MVQTAASLEPRPCGTSKACDQAGKGWRIILSDRFRGGIWHEVRAINPNSMKNDRDAACEGKHRNFAATPLRELGPPCSQPCRSAAVHPEGYSLAQRPPETDVTNFGNPA